MSFEAMEEEELRSLLIDIGHPDTRGMEYDELLAMAMSLHETPLSNSVPPTSRANDVRQVPSTSALPLASSSAAPVVSAATAGQGDIVDLSNDSVDEGNPVLNQRLQQFIEISGAEPTAAQHLLEACAYDLDAALALHLAEAGSHSATASATTNNNNNTRATPDDVMDFGHLPGAFFAGGPPPIPPAMLRAMGAASGNPYLAAARATQYAARAHRGAGMDEEEFYGYGEERYSSDEDENEEVDSATKKSRMEAEKYEAEHGVRRPDPVRQQRLVDDGPYRSRQDPNFIMPSHNGRGSLDPPGVSWLFAPATDLSYPGGFEEAKLLARSDKKWLLVNIQSHTEFASQMLNRDTWTDETVVELVRSHCIFWQRGHLTEDGKQYLQLYRVDPTELPHIAIIDARTGAKVTALHGYHEPAMFLAFLVEFVDENKVDGMTAPRVRNLKSQSSHQAGDFSSSTYGNSFEALDLSMDGDEDVKVGGAATEVREPTAPTSLPSSSSAAASQNSLDQLKPAATAAAAVAKTAAELYGSAPSEPPADDKTALRISLKPATGGKPLVRRYRPTDTVRSLYAVAAGLEAEAQTRPFDVARSYPLASLSDSLDATLAEAGLGGTQVLMRWI